MKKYIFYKFIIVLGLAVFVYSIFLYFFNHVKWSELSRLVALSYVLFVYGVLNIKNVLCGETFIEALKLTMFVYAVFYVVVLLVSIQIWESSTNFVFEGILTKTEYFLMVFISIVAIKIKWLKYKQK